jgi:hypothetical protein
MRSRPSDRIHSKISAGVNPEQLVIIDASALILVEIDESTNGRPSSANAFPGGLARSYFDREPLIR